MSGSSTYTDQQLSILATVVEQFAQSGDRSKEAAARFELGRGLFQMEQGSAAFEQLRRAVELFEQDELAGPAGQALLGCGHALTTEGRHQDSLAWFDRAINQFACSGYTAGELEASAAKLEALADLNQWSDTDLASKIIAWTEKTDSPELLTSRLVAFRYLAQSMLAVGDPVRSLEPSRQAADVAGRLGNPYTEATFRLAYAHNLRIIKQMGSAAEEYKRVQAITHGLSGAEDLERQAVIGLGATL
ncbi:hypothetical protein [Streptomyces sp. NPDC002845]